MINILVQYGKDFDIPKLASCIQNPTFQIEISSTLDKYKSIVFKSKSFTSLKIPDNRKDLITCVDEFITIAKKYANVNVIYSDNVCMKCLSIVECNCVQSSQKKPKTDYEDEGNFMKSIARYQGKQSRKIDFVTLKKELDLYFSQYGFPIGDEIKKLDFNEDQRTKGKTNITKMINALSKLKRPNLYEDVNLICHEYWGWNLPDISFIVDKLIEDYRKTQKVYISLSKTRKSCLNLQYRLFKHLQALEVPVKKEDFRIPTTDNILVYHDSLWEQMCLQTGIRFIPTI